jgi:hypothetical protein
VSTPADPTLVAAVRDTLADSFSSESASALPAVCQLLDEQASASSDRDEQKLLRDAAGLLRESKAGLAKNLAHEVRERFDAKLKPADDQFSKTAKFSIDSLTLVDDFQMEEEIVLGHCTKALQEQSDQELFALTQRVRALAGREDIAADKSPVFPRIFGRSLFESLSATGCSPQIKLRIFKAFQPSLLDIVPKAYAKANQMLIERGVIIEIKDNYGKPVISHSRPAAQPMTMAMPQGMPQGMMQGTPQGMMQGTPQGTMQAGGPMAPMQMPAGMFSPSAAAMTFAVPAAESGDVQGMLQRLFAASTMAHASGQAIAAQPAAPTQSLSPAAGAQPGTVTVQIRPELLEALRRLESQIPARAAGAAAAGDVADISSSGQGSLFPATEDAPLTNIVRNAKRELLGTLSPADGVVIDIVAAVFDRLFEDPRLPDALKALLGRLQMPVLKLAMQDQSMFTNSMHPVRGLIDCIAEFAISQPDLLSSDPGCLQSIAGIVEDVIREHPSNPQAFEQGFERLTALFAHHEDAAAEQDDLIRGLKEGESLDAAKAAAATAIAVRLAGAGYPAALTTFVATCWKDVLARAWREGGEEGEVWQRELSTLDDLLWSVAPLRSHEDHDRLMKLLPSLLTRLDEGIAQVEYDPALKETFFDELCNLHMRIMRAHDAADSAKERAPDQPPPQAPSPSSDAETTVASPAASLTREGLYRGCWVEFTDAGGAKRRCRLNWLSATSGACVFKDYESNTSFAIERDDLKARLQAKTALLVEGCGLARATIEEAIKDVAKEVEKQ